MADNLRLSNSMAALRRNVLTWRPGATVFAIGDAAHLLQESGHNLDDTPGQRAELSDPDSTPERRSIDVMKAGPVGDADLRALWRALVSHPSTRQRLYYVIYDGWIIGTFTNWAMVPYEGENPHYDHLHASGWWEDDANGADWPTVLELGGSVEAADVWNSVHFGKDDNRRSTGQILTETRSAAARIEKAVAELSPAQGGGSGVDPDTVEKAVRTAVGESLRAISLKLGEVADALDPL